MESKPLKANMKQIIKLEAEIDLTKAKGEVKVKLIDGIWQDFGYFLEVTGFMAYQAMKYKEKTPEEIADYARNYIMRCLKDYKRI